MVPHQRMVKYNRSSYNNGIFTLAFSGERGSSSNPLPPFFLASNLHGQNSTFQCIMCLSPPKSCQKISGTIWMVIWEKNFKYLKAQQEGQQISIFFKSKFHNEGGVCEKSYFEVFFYQWSHLSFPKISTFTDPPLHVFCPYLQYFWQISDVNIFHWIFG